jgi:hypothetical protein
MELELSEGVEPLGDFWDTASNVLQSSGGTVGGAAATGAAIGTAIPGLGNIAGAIIGGVVGIITNLFNQPSVPQSALDPASPNYDPEIVQLYASDAACRNAGGTLMTDGRCVVMQGNQSFDLFSPTWRTNRVYTIPGATLYPPGSTECGPVSDVFDKSGASGCYARKDTRVELVAPGGQMLTLNFDQWQSVVQRGGINQDGDLDASAVHAVSGAQLNPDGTVTKPGILLPAAIAAGLYFIF